MLSLSRCLLAAATLFGHFGRLNASSQPKVPTSKSERSLAGVNVLKPIHLDDYENALGMIVRRDEGVESRLRARNQARLVFGSGYAGHDATIADLRIDFGKKRAIVLENIADLIASTQCSEGELRLVFSSDELAEQAFEDWDKQSAELFIITSGGECTGDGDRHIYSVDGIVSEAMTVALSVVERQWEDVITDFTMSLGSATFAEPRHLYARQNQNSEDKEEEGGSLGFQDFLDLADVDEIITDESKFRTKFGNETAVVNVYPGLLPDLITAPGIEVDCVGCYVDGNFTAKYHFEIRDSQLFDFAILFNATGFKTQLIANVVLSKNFELRNLPEVTLFDSTLIPGALGAINIPRIFHAGPAFEVKLGIEASVSGELNFTTSVGVALKPNSVIMIDIDNPKNSTSDFNMTTVSDFAINSLDTNLNVGIYAEAALTFGINVLNKRWLLDAGFHLKTPRLSADMTMGYNKDGYCEDDEGNMRTGVTISPKLDSELTVNVEKKVGKIGAPEPIVERVLWSEEKALTEKCIPVLLPKAVADELQKEAERKEAEEEARRKLEEESFQKEVLSKPGAGGDGKKGAATAVAPNPSLFALFAAIGIWAFF